MTASQAAPAARQGAAGRWLPLVRQLPARLLGKLLLCLAAWSLAMPASCDALRLDAPEEVRALLERFLELGEVADTHASASERRLQREVGELLASEGYFAPRVALQREAATWVLTVVPGTRALVREVHLEVTGDLAPQRRQALLANWLLATGQPFRQAAWDQAKQSLLAELLAVDHAAARLRETRAEVDLEEARVDLHVLAESGPRYRFGELQITGLQRYSPELVHRFNRSVKPGDAYSEERLLALQAALQSSGYFSSASVTLAHEEAVGDLITTADGSLLAPVRVQLRERAPYRVSFGAGYGSNTGARVEGTFRNIDFLRRAWELQSGVRLEQVRQTAYADVFLPPDARARRDGFGVALEHSEIENLGIARVAFGILRAQRRGSVEQRLGINWQQEKQSPKDAEPTTNRALTASASWLWRHAADALDAAEGIALHFQIGGASKQLFSDQDFVRTYLRYSQGIPLGKRNALLLRGEIGVTFAQSSRGIPQDFLFRAGGTNSVRGYAYQSLGVQQGAATVGGRYLTTLSAEHTHWFDETWGAALFVDAGHASDDWRSGKLAVGYGIGARWKSPAGPLGIDLAYAQRERKMRFDFSLAIPF